jgi:hypothetical protein
VPDFISRGENLFKIYVQCGKILIPSTGIRFSEFGFIFVRNCRNMHYEILLLGRQKFKREEFCFACPLFLAGLYMFVKSFVLDKLFYFY